MVLTLERAALIQADPGSVARSIEILVEPEGPPQSSVELETVQTSVQRN